MEKRLKRTARVIEAEKKIGMPIEKYLAVMNDMGKSKNDVAKIFGVYHTQISYWHEKLGIKGVYSKGQPQEKIRRMKKDAKDRD